MFSRLAGFSERAIADWESGKPVSEPGLQPIKELDRFRDRLSEIVASDAIPAWLDTPNEAFDGLKPLEVIERGEIDRLWNMIFYLESWSRELSLQAQIGRNALGRWLSGTPNKGKKATHVSWVFESGRTFSFPIS